MAWLWSSREEFVAAVHPRGINEHGAVGLTWDNTTLENHEHLFDTRREMQSAVEELSRLGLQARDDRPSKLDENALANVFNSVVKLIWSGEELLACHRRLAMDDASYGFFHSNDLLDHWKRYAASGRIAYEVGQLVKDCNELLAGFDKLMNDDRRFLERRRDLPADLRSDFLTARNLFSCGFDDVGILIVGRAMERVVRRVVATRRIMLVSKAGSEAAETIDYYDVVEVLFRLKWQRGGARVISSSDRALLHYFRTVRNEVAHPSEAAPSDTPRETASIALGTASRLWKTLCESRARLAETNISKAW